MQYASSASAYCKKLLLICFKFVAIFILIYGFNQKVSMLFFPDMLTWLIKFHVNPMNMKYNCGNKLIFYWKKYNLNITIICLEKQQFFQSQRNLKCLRLHLHLQKRSIAWMQMQTASREVKTILLCMSIWAG